METGLKSARQAQGWSQHRLLVELEGLGQRSGHPMPSRASLKTQISRWENGHVSPHEPYRSMLAEIYRCSPADLGLGSDALWLPPQRISPSCASAPEFVASMEGLLEDYARADNAIGPRQLVAAVVQQMMQLDSAVLAARDNERRELLRLCSRFAEFAGWLCHDAGDLASAQRWTDKAQDYLEEVGSPRDRAYVLMRKSTIAADCGELTRAVSLADALAAEVERMPSTLAALVLRQGALAHAMARDGRASEHRAGRALEFASAEGAEPQPYAYCTQAFVLMETGQAQLHLGRYDDAVERLTAAAGRWPDGYVRDQALCLARLALAEACRGNLEGACDVGASAVELTRRTGSARALAVVRAVRHRLAPHSRHTVVSEFMGRSRP